MPRVRIKDTPPERDHHLPLPEVISPGDWQIDTVPVEHAPGVACSSVVERQMIVPTDASMRARAIRLHELAHVKWSPPQLAARPGIPMPIILACEDGRIITMLDETFDEWREVEWDATKKEHTTLRNEHSFPEMDKAAVKTAMSTGNLAGAAAQIVCGLGSKREVDARQGLDEWLSERYNEVTDWYDPDQRAKYDQIAAAFGRVTAAANLAREYIEAAPRDWTSTIRAAIALSALVAHRTPTAKKPGDAYEKAVEDGISGMEKGDEVAEATKAAREAVEKFDREQEAERARQRAKGDPKPEPEPEATPDSGTGQSSDPAEGEPEKGEGSGGENGEQKPEESSVGESSPGEGSEAPKGKGEHENPQFDTPDGEQGEGDGSGPETDGRPEDQLKQPKTGPYDDIVWGDMTITTPPLPRRLPPKRTGRKHRPTDSGAVPVGMHRLKIDGRVFTRKQRYMGGVVLVDQSGSMHMTAAQVAELIVTAPGIEVWGYAGKSEYGELRRLAKNGRWVADADLKINMGGNTVDYPALEYISKLPEPRIWVSDGEVVPNRRSWAGNRDLAKRQCAELCRKARIVRLPDMDKAVEFLRKLAI